MTGDHIILCLLGVALLGSTWWGIHVNLLTQYYFVQFALYLAAVFLAIARPERFRGHRVLAGIVLAALVQRILFLFSTPSLSSDLYRYIWDGKLFNLGVNPYLYAADDAALTALRGPLWPGIADKWTFTVYPPLSELAYALAYRVFGESFLAMQALSFVADLGVVALVYLLLRQLGYATARLLVYAWSPLPALHYVHSGHHDPLMVVFLLLSLYLLLRGRPAWSGAAFAASVLAKFHTAILGPVLLRQWGWRGVLAGLVTGILLYAPFLGGGADIFHGLAVEASGVIFNDGWQFLIRWVVQLFVEDGRAIARYIAGLIVIAAGLFFLFRPSNRPEAVWQRSYFLLGLFLLVAPMVQPWYLGWILPFLCLALRPGTRWFPLALTPGLGFLLWTGAIELTDFSYRSDLPYFWWYARAVQYAPLTLLILWAAWQAVGAWRSTRGPGGAFRGPDLLLLPRPAAGQRGHENDSGERHQNGSNIGRNDYGQRDEGKSEAEQPAVDGERHG